MSPNNKLVKRFQALHLKKYGEGITYDLAEQQLQELADLVRLTAPPKKEESNAAITRS